MRIKRLELRVNLLGALFFILYSLFLLLPSVHAQVSDIGEARINAASPFYFLQSVREILEYKFAKTTDVKANLELKFANRRLAEVNSLAKSSDQSLIEPTLIAYLVDLDQLIGHANIRDETPARNLSNEIKLHMSFLQNIYGIVSDPRAIMSIRATINNLSLWDLRLIDGLNSAKQSAIAEEIIDSRLSACSFLSKEASDSALNGVERAILSERANKCRNIKP